MCGLILCRAPPHPPPCVHKSEGKSNRVHCYSMEQAYIGQLPQCIKDSLLATESVSTSGAAISTASTTFAGSTISLSPFLSLYLTLPIFWNVLLLFLTWFSSFLSSILLLIADPRKHRSQLSEALLSELRKFMWDCPALVSLPLTLCPRDSSWPRTQQIYNFRLTFHIIPLVFYFSDLLLRSEREELLEFHVRMPHFSLTSTGCPFR